MSARADDADGAEQARAAFHETATLLADAKALGVALEALAEQCGSGAAGRFAHALGDGVTALSRFLHLAHAETDRRERHLNGWTERWDRAQPTPPQAS